jgi:acyl-CoA thioesterase
MTESQIIAHTQDAFAAQIGVKLLEADVGYAKATLTITPEHFNGFRVAHGGAIFTLADFAFGVAANADGNVTLAINVNISYLKAVTSGTLFAEAQEVSRNPKLATYTVRVTNDQDELIATFQGMAYRKKERLIP